MKYQVIKQHYDLVPGTVLYSVPNMGPELFTVREGEYVEPWLRLVPQEKVEKSTT